MLLGKPNDGRQQYQQELDIFFKYRNVDDFTKATTNIHTELQWAYSEENSGDIGLSEPHIVNA